jgi:uncharacterized SAM-binding protein YcdF (DUF218 family)
MLKETLAAVARGLALFLGLFDLLNLLAGVLNPGLNLNLWWIDLRFLPYWLSWLFLVFAAFCLIEIALGASRPWPRRINLSVVLILLYFSALNARQYYELRASGGIYSGPPVPFSLLLGAAFAFIFLVMLGRQPLKLPAIGKTLLVLSFLASFAAFPVLQIYCFGATDYRRQADVIVVFGAQARDNDHPSTALADRVRTAVMLYHEGLAPRLIFSGGPAKNGAHETEAMRRLAMKLGVPDSAIILDKQGLSTHDTVMDTGRIFSRLHFRRILAVSHAFHLPRIKMSYQRAGWEVFTVPLYRPAMSSSEYRFMLIRETAALWAYYLRGA